MAEELRLALSLLGSLAVGAVVLHGIWTVRKNSLQERKQAELEKEDEPEIDEEEQETQALRIKQMEIDFSELSDQEQGGGLPLGEVDVDSIYNKNQNSSASAVALDEVDSQQSMQVDNPNQGQLYEQAHSDDGSQGVMRSDVSNNANSGSIEQTDPHSNNHSKNENEKGMGEFLSHARNVTSKASNEAESEPFIEGFSALGDIENDDRIEPSVNLDETSISSNAQGRAIESPTQSKEQTITAEKSHGTVDKAPEVLILFVDKPEGEMIEGAKLLPLLLTLGFKFGEMDFFHRHEQSSGHGEVLFSLANMYNPGTFDIDHMEQVATRGLSIFMTLPNAGEPLQTFNMMHNAAKKIADEFGAQVLDAERQPLDVVRVRNYVDKIRKY